MLKRPPLTFLLALAATCLCALPAAQAEYKVVGPPLPGDPMSATAYELENGLTVYLTENHESPRFYAEIAVRAGSKNDPAESTGLAHYLEHLLFKGTQRLGTLDFEKEQPHIEEMERLYDEHFNETDPDKRKAIYARINEASQRAAEYAVPNEMDRIYQAWGANGLNAHTWNEETVYKVNLPSNRLRHWAVLESERFVNPVWRLFQTELETVYEEMNRALDNKQRIIMYAVDDVLYKVHPYGQQPTIGTVEHLKNPSLSNIRKFYDTYYVPNNMAIFISGDINKETTIAIIDEHFSSWDPKKLPKQKAWREKPLDGRETVTVTYEGEEYVLLAFRTAKRSYQDADALRLLDMVLDNASAGLINLNLNQKQRVRQAGSFPYQMNDYGSQYLWGVPKEGQTLEEVEALLLEQLEIIKRGEIEDWLLPAIINDFKKTIKGGLESDEARVSSMRDAWLGYESWEHAVQMIDRMEKLTTGDLARVAKKYFNGDYVAGFRKDAPHEVPDIQKPELAKVDIDPSRQSKFGMELTSLPVDPIAPVFVDPAKDYKKIEDPKGITYFYTPNPINDIFTFSITVDFGAQDDSTIGTATMLLDKSGAGPFSAEDLKKEWYKLGTDFGIGAGDNETTISLSGLDENFGASIKLLMDVLQHPAAEVATLEELKSIILLEREDAKKQAPSIAAALMQYNRYGAESSFLRVLPEAALKQLSVEALHGVTQRLLDYKHVISYTGSLPWEQVEAVLHEHHPVNGVLKDPPPYRYMRARAPAATEIYFVPKETAQANIRIEFGSTDYDAARIPAVELFNDYFSGGMSGVVFQELREARALAYSAGARYALGYRKNDQNLMLGGIQSQNDKAVEATHAFVDLIDNMPVSEDRLAIAKDSVINNYRTGKIGFRGISGAVRSWERHGLSPDPRRQWFEEIQAGSMDTVVDFHKEIIANHPKLISIVGDKTKIDLEGLKELGPIREIGIDEIFVD